MKKAFVAALLAGSLSLGACASGNGDLAAAGAGATVGAVAGAGLGAITAGAPIEGALIGAAVGGIVGAVWADMDNDGRADGYYRNGQYYPGVPEGYSAQRNCRSVLGGAGTGAAIGGVAGAGLGAVTGLGVLESAIAGAVVGGVAGAIWTDRNNDGCVDGYMSNGQYYEGVPPSYESATPTPERG